MNEISVEDFKKFKKKQKERNKKKVIKSQTGSGKTEKICNFIRDLVGENCIIAVPTNALKREVFSRLKNMGIENVKMTPQLDRLYNEEIEKMQCYLRDIGAWGKRKSFLEAQVALLRRKAQKQFLSETEKKDLDNIDFYLSENEIIKKYKGHIVTTHERALNLNWYLQTTHSLIIDEDIIQKTCIKTPKLLMRYIENTFDVASEVLGDKIQKKLEQIKNAPFNKIVPTSVCKQDYIDESLQEILEETLASTNKCICNIYDLLQCSAIYKYHDSKENEIKVQCLICRKPPLMKTIFFSATADENIYKNFFKGDDIEFIELPKAKYKGKIIQDCTITYSRRALAKDDISYKNGISEILERIREKHKGLPLITFKKFCRNEEYHFGAIEGLDVLKGQDIVVVGLPYHNELQYRFFMYAIYGTIYNPTEKARFRRIDNGYYSFKLNTYDNEKYQKIQKYLIGSDLEQAVGRARLLRYYCTVYVYSGFPVEQANIVYNTLELPKIDEEAQQNELIDDEE